ncbi:anaphase-promoting complex subunit 10 [Blastocystis sp. subtype 4]|uniref:anaphase-promoting complex subunit 10 n=1 Tax=Blastocystis sp. subtype 4 TaxID=944170 RepID=UPI0007115D5C|nr:anaphase-promoting complex subunit 10 [Blastocystis sp. subtype 4]KNB46370.1 anaphase-promoting complex subunit 10 [Blastocystis sp. subtype 4]|eukprot:XP_014529813.1 anaphase-promoting complex subunit 10 [Blastocystis sp. subtype 4]
MPSFENITLNGSWSVSSAELGHGVGNMIDGDVLTTYWQSKAEPPHTVSVNVTSFFVDSDIKFTTKQMISSIKFYISYAMDSTYSPLLVSILYGQDGQQYKEFKTFSISEVNDWFVDTFRDNHPLKAFSLQFWKEYKNSSNMIIQILSPEMIPLQINKLFEYSDPLLQSQITLR